MILADKGSADMGTRHLKYQGQVYRHGSKRFVYLYVLRILRVGTTLKVVGGHGTLPK